MTGAVYERTPLPVKLDLSKYNTAEQLKGSSSKDRGVEDNSKGAAVDSTKDCNAVMRKDLRAWLEKNGIHGPPPTPVAEQRAMWSWIRDFHQEYSDDWFSRNMPRLHEQFKPVFVQEMKSRKKDVAAAAPTANDMLDLGEPASSGSAPQPSAGTNTTALNAGMDLLSLSDPAPAAAAPKTQPVATAAPPNPSSSLLDLGATSSAVAPTPSPASVDLNNLFDLGVATPAPSTSAQPTQNIQSGLLDLGTLAAAAPMTDPKPAAPAAGDGLLGLDVFAPTSAPAAPAQPSTTPATASSTAPKEAPLFDLMM
mmetsp:Transcript_8333/g.15210  ORF Transcript_8333/g.15210 Transcript_8333/m.15210 type:complete len:309 (-) Transcript_8333:157-1083(-)